MNLVLLQPGDFHTEGRASLTAARFRHIGEVHRAVVGDELTVGLIDGRIGTGRVILIDSERVELDVRLDRDPPPPLDLTLLLALPRPKVLDRVIAATSSLGVKRIYLINAWRVEKSYWKSPRLKEENLREQAILGLEQAKDTVMPRIEMRRLFRPFVEQELPGLASGTTALVAHPYSDRECPQKPGGSISLAIGPEGGFIPAEIDSLTRIGFVPVTLGDRILRVETAIAAVIGRLF